MNEQHKPDNTNLNDQAITDAFGERATRLAQRSPAGISDVYRRVDRHRQRRRSLAGVGAAAVLLVGVGGLAIANQRGDSPAASPPTPTSPPSTTALVAAAPVANSPAPWRCVDPVDPPAGATPDGASYFNWCEPVAIDVANDPATALPGQPVDSSTTSLVPQTMPAAATTTQPGAPQSSSGIPMTMPPEWSESVSINSGITYYIVQPDDSLTALAERFGRNAEEVAAVNDWSEGAQHEVVAGDVVLVPTTVTIIGPSLPPLPASGADPAIGQLTPAILGTDFDGSLSGVDPFSATGPPTLVVVSAHWCPHCDAEVSELLSLVDANRLPAGLDIIAISSAENPEMPNWPASEWFKSRNWPFPTMVDAGDSGNVAAQALGVEGFPAMVLIGPDDVVLDRWVGAIGADEIANRINGALS